MSRLRHIRGTNDDGERCGEVDLFPVDGVEVLCRAVEPARSGTAIDRRGSMGIHVYGVTVATLEDVSRAARAVDHAVTLIDDSAHMVVLVDQRGRVVIRSEDAPVCPD
jgi:hypothetical protein